jgi:hypothetical protein
VRFVLLRLQIGRPLCGFGLDILGRVNGAAIFTFLAGLSNLVVWMNAKKFGVLLFYAFLQGRCRQRVPFHIACLICIIQGAFGGNYWASSALQIFVLFKTWCGLGSKPTDTILGPAVAAEVVPLQVKKNEIPHRRLSLATEGGWGISGCRLRSSYPVDIYRPPDSIRTSHCLGAYRLFTKSSGADWHGCVPYRNWVQRRILYTRIHGAPVDKALCSRELESNVQNINAPLNLSARLADFTAQAE